MGGIPASGPATPPPTTARVIAWAWILGLALALGAWAAGLVLAERALEGAVVPGTVARTTTRVPPLVGAPFEVGATRGILTGGGVLVARGETYAQPRATWVAAYRGSQPDAGRAGIAAFALASLFALVALLAAGSRRRALQVTAGFAAVGLIAKAIALFTPASLWALPLIAAAAIASARLGALVGAVIGVSLSAYVMLIAIWDPAMVGLLAVASGVTALVAARARDRAGLAAAGAAGAAVVCVGYAGLVWWISGDWPTNEVGTLATSPWVATLVGGGLACGIAALWPPSQAHAAVAATVDGAWPALDRSAAIAPLVRPTGTVAPIGLNPVTDSHPRGQDPSGPARAAFVIGGGSAAPSASGRGSVARLPLQPPRAATHDPDPRHGQDYDDDVGQQTVDVAAAVDAALDDDIELLSSAAHPHGARQPAPADEQEEGSWPTRKVTALEARGDDFTGDTPVRQPAPGQIRAGRDLPAARNPVGDATALTPLDQMEVLAARARHAAEIEVDPDDVEAAIDSFPRPNTAGPPPATRRAQDRRRTSRRDS